MSPDLPWFVGAYPLLPKDGDRAGAYRALVRRAEEQPEFRGLEVPFTGDLDVAGLGELLGERHQVVLTGIPGVVARLADYPSFGLASADEDGRRRALAFTRDAHDAARRLDDATGRQATRAVLVHASSAPGAGSPDAFRRSMAELLDWEWGETLVLVEHCDAAVEGVRPAKGFLRLDDELDALASLDAGPRAGVLINWGRSAIEGRDPALVVDHVTRAREQGQLRGLMFSGCTPSPESRGGAWADVHLPPAPVDASSALTAELARAAAGAAGTLDVVGMKIGAPKDAAAADRERTLTESAAILLAAIRG
jgi:hypothetical protein